MTELLTSAQMRAIEATAMASGSVTGLALMERAGRGVVDAMFQEWPDLASTAQRAVVLCGPGNNGGDGFVVARRLRDKGWEVEVLLYGDPEKLPPDARRNYEVWVGMGAVIPLSVETAAAGKRPACLIDAMFGTGLTRAIPLACANAFHAVGKRGVDGAHPSLVPYRRVAVDCPSGLDCDSGKFLLPDRPDDHAEDNLDGWSDWWTKEASRRLLHCDLAVTFHRRKIGHAMTESLGKVRVVDIGLGKEDRHPAHLKCPRGPDIVHLLDFAPPNGPPRRIWPGHDLDKRRGLNGHKYSHGHALVLSGGSGRGGAARLAARGALRIGAGVVTVGCPPLALQENASALTAVMLKPVADADAFAGMLEDARINALCLGPALGQGEREAALVAVALRASLPSDGAEAARGVVLDADALTILARAPGLFADLHGNCVLTPHAGEFARLFPDIAERLGALPTRGPAFSKVEATREAAARAGCVVLFKGPDTVIAAPDGRCSINAAYYERAAPWLATAGSGDVLAGFIAGLLARGLEPMQAAETAAWLHVECARGFGPGLIAEDLPEQLPKVFRNLGI